MNRWAKLLQITSLWFLVMGTTKPCAGYEFTVEGEIRVGDYSEGDTLIATNHYQFKAEVRDCSSRIRVFGGWLRQIEYNEYGWNGTSSYLYVKFWGNPTGETSAFSNGVMVSSGTLPINAKVANGATLCLYPTDIPEKGRGMEPVWLAYGSGCHYAARVSGAKVEPIWRSQSKFSGQKELFTSLWKFHESPPALLESLTDFAKNDNLISHDKEMTNANYSVLSWTNVSGMSLPLEFKIVHLRPSSSGLFHRVYDGVAHSIRPVCNVEDFFPRTDSVATRVFDERLSKDTNPVDHITYLSKSGDIVQSLDALRKTEAYTKAFQRLRVAESTKADSARIVRWTLLGFGFVSTTIFLIWILVKRTPRPGES